jgi:hypothetical protein
MPTMNRTKYLKGECQHCAGHLEFLAEHIGVSVPCPHCGQETELLLAQPLEQPSVPRRAVIWTLIAVVVLGLGLAGALVALRKAEKWAENQKRQSTSVAIVEPHTNSPPPDRIDSPPQPDLQASSVSLDHAPGTSLIYAIGSIKNNSTRQRFGVKVELELSDDSGRKLGTATDYRQVLEPGAEWPFKALVVDPKTKSAKVVAVREDQ